MLSLNGVESNGPINMPSPNQFQIGNPDKEPEKWMIHFDNLLVESLKRQSSQQVKKQKKVERRRRGKKEDGTSKDHLPHEGDGSLNAETGKDP